MNEGYETPQRRTFQFSLRFLLIVCPIIAALLFGYFAARNRLRGERERLIELHAALYDEALVPRQDAYALEKSSRLTDAWLQKWRSPDMVARHVSAPEETLASGYWSSDHQEIDVVPSSMIFFFSQAEEEDVRTLIARLEERYPRMNEVQRCRTLRCLRMLPDLAPLQLGVMAPDAQRMLMDARKDEDRKVVAESILAQGAIQNGLRKLAQIRRREDSAP